MHPDDDVTRRTAVVYKLPWLPPGVNTNHQYLHGGRAVHLRPEVQLWRDLTAIAVHNVPFPWPEGPLKVLITLWPPNRRRRDVDGTIKPILDAVFGAKGEDDARITELTVIKLDPQPSGFNGIVISIEGREKQE